MLPPRAYAEPLAPFSSNMRAHTAPTEVRPPLIVAVAPEDVDRFPMLPFTRYTARTTAEAVRLIEQWRPRLIAIDWELPKIDPGAVCNAARQIARVGILAVMESPERAPAALKAGCHAILLKPFPLNLVAARLGRLSREMPAGAAAVRLGASHSWGTNRIWPAIHCPTCNKGNAVSFDYSSHRRSWYACVACDHVWLGPRRDS
jgi:DNA-binding response OmpR family regulator